jgi:hypothetical protein
MSATNAERWPGLFAAAKGNQDPPDVKTDSAAVCPAFSKSGNVALRSKDNMTFRVNDFHLKAAR